MRLDVTAVRDGLSGRRAAWVAAGLAVVASGGAIAALASGRAAAEKEAAWYRQRLAEKRALVRALQSDLAVVAQTTERVSQMAVIAREQNVEVRRLASVEEPRAVNYSPERIAALDDVARTRSDYAARALAQLGFLEEQLASTTDSLSLMAALAQGPRVEPQTSSATPAARSKKAKVATPDTEAVEGAVPAGWPVAGEVSSGWVARIAVRQRVPAPYRPGHQGRLRHARACERPWRRRLRGSRLGRVRQDGRDRPRPQPEDALWPPLGHLRARGPAGATRDRDRRRRQHRARDRRAPAL
jgi:hypothetical protein